MPDPIDIPEDGKLEISKAVMKKVTDDYVVDNIYQVQLDESKWACIAGDYFIKTSNGWSPRKATEYDSYFGKNKRGNIDSYFEFFVDPNHENYNEFKYTVDGISVNWYRPLSYEPKQGNWDSINKVLRHLGASEEYGYDFILDWLWLKHKYPKLPTPFILLVGGKGGGKSTWEDVCSGLWEDNFFAAEVSQVLGEKNIHLFGKNVVHIREKAFDSRYSSSEMQKLKARTTAKTTAFRALYQNTITGVNYCGWSLDSNDVNNAIAIEEENRRFVTFDVGRLSENQRYTGIFKEIKDQSPAFSHYLLYEHKPSSKLGCFKNDLYFYEKYINSKATKRVQGNSMNEQELIVEEYTDRLQDVINSLPESCEKLFVKQSDFILYLQSMESGKINRTLAKKALLKIGGIYSDNCSAKQYRFLFVTDGTARNFYDSTRDKKIGAFIINIKQSQPTHP